MIWSIGQNAKIVSSPKNLQRISLRTRSLGFLQKRNMTDELFTWGILALGDHT